MSKYLLLIDDKEEFKDDFLTVAQRHGYGLAWGRSFEDLSFKLPTLHLSITVIILDIKCLMSNDQEIERADFIGSALNFLNREYPDVPRLILTGDEKALESVRYIHQNDEDIYKKEPEELTRLFAKLEEYNHNHDMRVLNFKEREIIGIIQNGEGKHLEYKSSIQYCVKSKSENKDLRYEVFKNIAAFANSDGGEILLGVDDNKNIIGLENTDYLTFSSDDKQDALRLLIDGLVESNFGNNFQEVLSDMQFYNYKGTTVCRIVVKGRHSSPTYLRKKPKNNKHYEAFYVRGQGSARELATHEIDEYIKSHWNL